MNYTNDLIDEIKAAIVSVLTDMESRSLNKE